MSPFADSIVQGQWVVTLRPYTNDELRSEHLKTIKQLTDDPATPFRCKYHDHSDIALSDLRGYTVKCDEDTKKTLETLPDVQAVEPLKVYHHCEFVSQSPAPWGISRLSSRGTLPSNSESYRYIHPENNGDGAIAYVLDTGINEKHEDFGDRASKGKKFVDRPSNWVISDQDVGGHGTHVAGTIGGTKHGVAKKVTIVGVKVFDDGDPSEPPNKRRAGASNADLILAIEWVVKEFQRHQKPSVVNLSLGGAASDALDAAIANAVKAGVVVVVAAGNENWFAESVSPAREPLAITVGATDLADKLSGFSNYGKIVDILAPGSSITSTWIGTTNKETKTISGTSMATPHVVGAITSILGKVKKHPLEIMPILLAKADKNVIDHIKDQTINALLHAEYDA